jgi:hypothetical protein
VAWTYPVLHAVEMCARYVCRDFKECQTPDTKNKADHPLGGTGVGALPVVLSTFSQVNTCTFTFPSHFLTSPVLSPTTMTWRSLSFPASSSISRGKNVAWTRMAFGGCFAITSARRSGEAIVIVGMLYKASARSDMSHSRMIVRTGHGSR